MRVPIVCVDERLRQYAQTFADCFSRPQYKHFVTVLRPHHTGESVPDRARLEPMDGGYILRASVAEGEVVISLRVDAASGTDDMSATLYARDGRVLQTFPGVSRRSRSALANAPAGTE